MKINLHIDRLVLEGINITSDQQGVLQISVETELNRLFSDRGFTAEFTQNIALSRLVAESIQLANSNNPVHLGQQIAQSVYGGIVHE